MGRIGSAGGRLAVARLPTRRELLQMVVVAALYYAAARFSLRFALVGQNVTPLWPPTGIALVAFLRYGKRLWPGVMLGALLVNLPISTPLVALATSVGNTLAPLLAARFLDQVGFRHTFERVRDVTGLVVLAALLSMTVSATIGTTSLALSAGLPPGGFWQAWTVWWTGDAMGILVVAPFLWCLLAWRELRPAFGWRQVPEAALLFGLLLVASLLAVWGRNSLLFLIPPLVGWIAWRFRLRGAAPAVLLVSIVAVWSVVRTIGWFADLSLWRAMLTLQLFDATAAFTALFVAALVSERVHADEALTRAATELDGRVRQRTVELRMANEQLAREVEERRATEQRLRRSERELAETQQLARLGRWEWDLATGAVAWSDEMYRIHGYAPGAFPVSFDKAVELVPEEDRGRIERHMREILTDPRQELHGIEYRIVRADGELRALFGRGRVFFAPDGTPTRLVGAVIDVTERRDYDRQHHIAETLQRALLPQELPSIDGLALAASYVPAEVGFRAGGDWYDVIAFGDGRVALVIGDVAGHGLEAASVMGQLRMSVRALALEGHGPADVVTRADSVFRSVAPREFATMLYVDLDVGTGLARIVRAGHPPPLAITSRGASYLEMEPDPPIGLGGSRTYRAHVTRLDPADRLVLFTDGLIDRRGSTLEERLQALETLARSSSDRPAKELTRGLVDALVPADVTDDVAVLIVERLPPTGDVFRLRVPAEPAELSRVRRSFSRWLDGQGLGTDQVDDLVLVCSELCSNAVVHAYGPAGGEIDVRAERSDGTIELVVRDFGRWRRHRERGGGRGLAMVEGLTHSLVVDRDAAGTAVRIRRDVHRTVSR